MTQTYEPLTEQSELSTLISQQESGRLAILTAAATAFVTRGFAATSMDDIAEQLNSSKGRIYHYYRTKGDLFLGIHRQALELCLSAILPIYRDNDTAAGRLRRMAIAQMELIRSEHDLMRLGAQHAEIHLAGEGRTSSKSVNEVLAMRREFEALYVDIIRQGIESGEFRASDPSLLAKFVLGTINWMTIWYAPHSRIAGEAGPESIFNSVSTFILDGVLAE
jgi:AcrR family transcriptional regulator